MAASSSANVIPVESCDVLEQLITHIPDIIVHRSPKSLIPQTVQSYGVLMFGDISGFTALCENYCSTSESKKKGTDQLTSTLNSYLSQIVQAILKNGGDVLKFAGDALLAYWECSRFEASEKFRYVLQESLTMQRHFDNFQTPDGVTLRMKISLSVGMVDVHYIGDDTYRAFDITGPAVDDVNVAQSFTKPGTVVISFKAWKMCNQEKCFARVLGPDSCAVQVFKITVESYEPILTLTDLISHGYQHGSITDSSNESSRHSSVTSHCSLQRRDTAGTNAGEESILTLRRRSNRELLNFDDSRKTFIKSFISKTVVHKIDHGYNVNWLSELRQVSVLFINLDPDLSVELDGVNRKQHLLQSAFEVVYPILTKFDGSLNKIFMFDKGCTFLCIFGLPHASHEDDPRRALGAAIDIFNHLSALKLNHYSIGVTTGVAFCGVVGHSQRHEYTVIGDKVNMAARLMMKFPDVVTCDESTMIKSNIQPNQFSLTPPVQLKGLSKPEDIYYVSTENMDDIHVSNNDIHEAADVSTLIGRRKEMNILMAELEHRMEQSHNGPGIIVLTGPGGIGKTKLLRAMKARAAEMNFRVVSGTGGLIEQNTPFFTVKTLLTRLLELDTCSNIHDKEQLILEHVVDDDLRRLLPILNDLLVLKFPHTEETLHMCHKKRTKYLHQMLFRIVHKEALNHPCLFGVDDAQWVDHDSWKFLLDLSLDPHAILLLATRPLKDIQKSEVMRDIWSHPNTIVLELEGLSSDEMIEMAYQILNVQELPDQVVKIIRARSHGIPLWCEELVETMLELQVLTVIEEDEVVEEDGENIEEEKEEKFVGDEEKISLSLSNHIDKKKAIILKTVKRWKSCLGHRVSIDDIPIPDSVAGMVLTRIDNMNPSEQMSLKCAAILGTTFHRNMLKSIIPNCNQTTFKQTLDSLAKHGIIECAIAAEVRGLYSDIRSRSTHLEDPHLQCPCLKIQHHYYSLTSHGTTSHPPVTNCAQLQFVHTYIQETAYELWTKTQCQALHESAARYLESQAHKCSNCGGGGFFIGPKQARGKKNSTRKGRSFMGASAIRRRLRRTNEGRRSNQISSTELETSAMSTMKTQHERRLSSSARGQIVDYKTVCSLDFGIDLQACHCDEVLYHIYPQLVQHWRAAGNIEKTLKYLIESASAALATFNNMEAISLLQEAKEIVKDDKILSTLELARLESLFGQAYFQCGEVDECIPYFRSALHMLGTRLPSSIFGVIHNLMFQVLKQSLHVKFPQRFLGRKRGQDSDKFLEQSRCMAHVTHAYHMQHENIRTIMSALQQLNSAEEAQEDVHELIVSYTTMIECCLLFDFNDYGEMYLEKATTLSSSVQFGIEDISTYAHLLNVALNYKICHGMIKDALEIGSAVTKITSNIHDTPTKLASLPLLFEANLQALKVKNCEDNLKQLREVAEESDDLRAEALLDCCRFDALLEIGLYIDTGHDLAKSAELCCEEDVYHFDDIERFFLISSLALWHSRKDNITTATELITIAKTLLPKKYETFFAVKALVKFLECQLLLYKDDTNNSTVEKIIRKNLKKLKGLAKRFKFFFPRFLHLKAYFKYLLNQQHNAMALLKEAAREADRVSSDFESAWITKSFSLWFEDQLLDDFTPRVTLFTLQ